MSTGYKTSRVWPIPLMSTGGAHGALAGLSLYRPSSGRANYTRIRLVSVHLSLVDGEITCFPRDANLQIIAGIGDGTGVTIARYLSSNDPPRLDTAHPTLTPHQVWLQQGGFGIPGFNSFYQGGQSLSPVEVQWDRAIVGMIRYRRPLQMRWRKSERPEMELYDERACPCLWFRAYYNQIDAPPPLAWRGNFVGTVVFEADQ